MTDVAFVDNYAGNFGGGLCNSQDSNSILTNATFQNNYAVLQGGGMLNYSSNPTLTNITFSGNSSSLGGGIYNSEDSNPVLTNVSLIDNSAQQLGGGIYNSNSNPSLFNVLIWGNSPDGIAGSLAVVTYSDIQGGYPGFGNIDADPLLGEFGRNGGFTLTYSLLPGSPIIDAGHPGVCPEFDQRGALRPMDGNGDGISICDMGSFEHDATDSFVIYLPMILR